MKKLYIYILAIIIFAILPGFASAINSLGEAANFVVLALNNGTLIINSSKGITGDVGYSKGVTSNTNQKVDVFTGTAYVHSQVSSFIYKAATYQPSGGIQQNDAKLDQANTDALAASANYTGLAPNYTFGNVTTSLTINRTGAVTVVNMASLNYNSDIITLVGGVSGNDIFIINVNGSFDFSHAEVRLTNVLPQNVIFNFPTSSNININKADNIFKGIILAPTGSVIYENPASFEGAIIALNIDLHSDFIITQPGGGVIPVELVSFKAKVITPEIVQLSWATASEVNNDYIAIEKTSDLNNWENVCKVRGKGNSTEINNYSCMDSAANKDGKNTVYYRPKQVDFNGTYEYFNIIKLRLENSNTAINEVQNIYPNPATDRVKIQYNAAENGVVKIRLMSIEGKAILVSNYNAKQGQQVVDANLPENDLATGLYVLEVESEGMVYRQKVYKQ